MAKPFDAVLELANCPTGLPDQSAILAILSDTDYLRGISERLEYIAEMQQVPVAA